MTKINQLKSLLDKFVNPEHLPDCEYRDCCPINECPTPGCFEPEQLGTECLKLVRDIEVDVCFLRLELKHLTELLDAERAVIRAMSLTDRRPS